MSLGWMLDFCVSAEQYEDPRDFLNLSAKTRKPAEPQIYALRDMPAVRHWLQFSFRGYTAFCRAFMSM